MATVLKKPLTEDQKADAARLKSAWKRYQSENSGATQDWLGQETGLGGQSVIGQYLNAMIPINAKALLSICRIIGIDPKHISPTLAANMPPMVGDAPSSTSVCVSLAYVDSDELKILTLYRQSTRTGKNHIIDAARTSEKLR